MVEWEDDYPNMRTQVSSGVSLLCRLIEIECLVISIMATNHWIIILQTEEKIAFNVSIQKFKLKGVDLTIVCLVH